MASLRAPPLALYVHFPWCVRKCPYCDFNSYTLHGELAPAAYVARLMRDIEAQAPQVAGREVGSVFFGGGTPSLFAPEAIGRVLESARRHLHVAPDAEVTLEANPGAIERGAFREYRAAGVTRVSLGAQSFEARALRALGRIHSPEDTQRAAAELHAAGIGNFNVDLMYGLPGQELAGAVRDIEEALALYPAHLSHYHLTLESGTPFAARPPPLPDEDACAAMLEEGRSLLGARGFAQYEVSAYARAGAQCRHNLNYWTFGDYLGVGAGAHGKLSFAAPARVVRTTQLREPRRYLAAPDVALAQRTIPMPELPFEFMLNALRLHAGFEMTTFTARTGLGMEAIAGPLRAALDAGLLLATARGYRPSEHGLRFLNDLLLYFLPETPKKSGACALSMATPEVVASS
ncbi:MAG TPA: radical SAM family heme chaperone HemW [Steroidobacteraceae bacterium]|jgi:oxygen-independent coproporphyrinogen-3 oxidase|nr:radical SAM family heme chaperone HemW [Steroidobacteraceae bacterium]